MKKLGWLFFLAAFNLSAQDVILNPPLDVSPEAGRELSKDATTGSLVPAQVNPVDGQLKLGEKKSVETAATGAATASTEGPAKSEAEIVIPPRAEEIKLIGPTRFYSLEKYFQFSFGYLNSKWEKANSALDNGSTLTDFRVVADMNARSQFGFAIELIHDTSGESIPENIRALQYKLFIDHHRPLFADKLDWMAGLALSLGDYSIRKFGLNGSGETVYTKIKSGTIYGLIPSAGLRFYLGGHNSIDIGVEYHLYLSKPQSYIGGLAFVPRFSFVF